MRGKSKSRRVEKLKVQEPNSSILRIVSAEVVDCLSRMLLDWRAALNCRARDGRAEAEQSVLYRLEAAYAAAQRLNWCIEILTAEKGKG